MGTYTGQLKANEQVVDHFFGTSLDQLKITLMVGLDQFYSQAVGQIIDNSTGQVVYHCRKSACQ